MVRVLIGIILGVLLVPVAGYLWLMYGNVPVAVDDSVLPLERRITSTALGARIEREFIATPPVQANETNLVAGARIYTERCSVCHGLHGRSSALGADMFPHAPQLLEPHRNGAVVGVSDDPPGETFWKVSNGIRLTGMPSFKSQLSDDQMWQVTQFLANADKPMPPAALEILRTAPAPPGRPASKTAAQ